MMRPRAGRLWLVIFLVTLLSFSIILYGNRRNLLAATPFVNRIVSTSIYSRVIEKARSWAAPPFQAPTFHLLIPAAEKDPQLCKTLYSILVLGYPSPTLVSFNNVFTDVGGSYLEKIRGIMGYLSARMVKPDDLVLVADGSDVWFQLPPDLLVRRYHRLLLASNRRLKRKYGTVGCHDTGGPTGAVRGEPIFSQRVVYGVDTPCLAQSTEDAACTALPPSTVPDSVSGAETSWDAHGSIKRSKYLSPGLVMGFAGDIKAIYEAAASKLEEDLESLGDESVVAEIFSEQEHHRNLVRQASHSRMGRWRQWLSARLRLDTNCTTGRVLPKNDSVVPDRRYEYGIGLDYGMALFQTVTPSNQDIEFLSCEEIINMSASLPRHRSRWPKQLDAFEDLSRLPPPFSSEASDGSADSTLNDLPTNFTWADILLATNIRIPSIPAALHFNGDKSYLDIWWPRMWYHPHARALLYQRLHTRPTSNRHSALWSNNPRGGVGGVWTARGQWLSWGDLCRGHEDTIFNDGLGEWGKENGVGNVYDTVGELKEDVEIGV